MGQCCECYKWSFNISDTLILNTHFFNLKFKLNYILSDQLIPQPFVYVVESYICS